MPVRVGNDVISRPNRELPQAFYTGFVAEATTPLRGGDQGLLTWFSAQRRAKKFTILASAGGGREGYHHLKFALAACLRARRGESIALLVVCGPNLPADERAELMAMAEGRKNIRVCASVPVLKPFFHACDLSISHAGYNTAVHLLSAGCRSILVPMPREFVEERTCGPGASGNSTARRSSAAAPLGKGRRGDPRGRGSARGAPVLAGAGRRRRGSQRVPGRAFQTRNLP